MLVNDPAGQIKPMFDIGQEGAVEVKSRTPVKYALEPVLLSGKMTILKDDPMALYDPLTDATPTK
jgi:uncharacterized protein